jgi:predicted TIM-barrel fold metal-dependent hydrolase
VFERHPKLRLVLTELPGTWWPYVLTELDSIYLLNTRAYGPELATRVPKLPSDYCREQVFVGASFLARFEAEHAVEHGYQGNVIWGSDYPHAEGTFQYPDRWDDEPLTHVAMRHTFAGLDDDAIRAMIGENAVRAYGLDGSALTEVARRIGAPSCAELSVPVDTVPDDGGLLAFRQVGAWA